MARLLALVADTLAFAFSWTFARDMAKFATYRVISSVIERSMSEEVLVRTVIAFLSLGAITSHVAISAAGVARLRTAAITTAVRTSVATITTVVSSVLAAVTGNVSNLTTLVAFLGSGLSARFSSLGAIARDVPSGAAAIA